MQESGYPLHLFFRVSVCLAETGAPADAQIAATLDGAESSDDLDSLLDGEDLAEELSLAAKTPTLRWQSNTGESALVLELAFVAETQPGVRDIRELSELCSEIIEGPWGINLDFELPESESNQDLEILVLPEPFDVPEDLTESERTRLHATWMDITEPLLATVHKKLDLMNLESVRLAYWDMRRLAVSFLRPPGAESLLAPRELVVPLQSQLQRRHRVHNSSLLKVIGPDPTRI